MDAEDTDMTVLIGYREQSYRFQYSGASWGWEGGACGGKGFDCMSGCYLALMMVDSRERSDESV
jgi:hypothetical protein